MSSCVACQQVVYDKVVRQGILLLSAYSMSLKAAIKIAAKAPLA